MQVFHDPDDEELQVAGLVHDLAHVWDAPGQPRHGTMGADAVVPDLEFWLPVLRRVAESHR